jgi:cell division protein FtsI (penicillin-binding protein 3)
MRPADLGLYRFPPAWRWLIERIWRVEHAFERARAEGRAEDDTRLRIFFVLAMFTAGFLTLAAGAAKSVLFPDVDRGAYAGGPPQARADLTDRNGQLLAVDLPHFGVYYDPKENWDPEEIRRVLPSALPQLSQARLDHALAAEKRQYLIGGLTPEEKRRIDDLGLPGIEFEPEAKRVYLLGATAGNLIGFVDRGGAGLSGAELALDDAIRGGAGRDPVPLSIDLRVQSALQDELEKAAVKHSAVGGAGFVVNVRTGEILGMASYPAFDPNLGGANPPGAMVNHAAATVYEPGSVFKVFTVAMGLDAGAANPNTIFDVHTPLALPGQTIHDFDKGDTVLPLWEVFTHSSNIGAARLGLKAGAANLDHYFRAFGLFAAAPSELRESARPLLPPRMTSDNAVATMSFGHSISVSPLAVATGMTSILNGGNYIPLTIRKLDPNDPPPGKRVISEQTSRTMLELMRLNVMDGTGAKADVPGYAVGGKTGTATKIVNGHYDKAKNFSSFAAIFPTDGPFTEDRYLVLIMLDEPRATPDTYGFSTGGWTSAPAAGRVIERIAPVLHVKATPGPVIPFGPKLNQANADVSGEER